MLLGAVRRNVLSWGALAVAALMLVPTGVVAQEEEDDTYTHLYGHVYTIMRDGSGYADSMPSPMNTLTPLGENDFSRGGSVFAVYNPALDQDLPVIGSTCLLQFSLVLVSPWWGNCDPVYEVASNEAWFFVYNDALSYANGEEYFAAGGLGNLAGGKQLLKDIRLDTNKPIQAEFWMSADATAWFPWYKGCVPALVLCPIDDQMNNNPQLQDVKPYYDDIPWPYPLWNADYGIFPAWVVESRAYAVSPAFLEQYNVTGIPNAIVADEGAEGVTALAAGVTEPFDMYSLPTTTGGQVVYPFRPDMGAPLVDKIPQDHTIVWWVDWYADHGGTKVLYGQNFAVNSGEFFPPSLGLPITNPMDIEMVMPQFTDDNKLVIIALFNSPFVAYDVPLDSASFEIVRSDGSVIATSEDDTVTWMQKAAREQQSLLGVSPEAALKRGQATWLWNYLAEKDITGGDYTIRVTAQNQQGKSAAKEAYFTISEDLGAGAVTSSLGGMFTFSKEDITKIQECLGCHDSKTGDLLEGVQNVTMAEAKAMQEAGTLGTDQTEETTKKDTPAAGVVSLTMLLGAITIALRRKTE